MCSRTICLKFWRKPDVCTGEAFHSLILSRICVPGEVKCWFFTILNILNCVVELILRSLRTLWSSSSSSSGSEMNCVRTERFCCRRPSATPLNTCTATWRKRRKGSCLKNMKKINSRERRRRKVLFQ